MPITGCDDSPLASASLRYLVRRRAVDDEPASENHRPFGLLAAVRVDTPLRREICYCPVRQVAVDPKGRPLIEIMGKDWKTKSSTDGDEGLEENWGWEEE